MNTKIALAGVGAALLLGSVAIAQTYGQDTTAPADQRTATDQSTMGAADTGTAADTAATTEDTTRAGERG